MVDVLRFIPAYRNAPRHRHPPAEHQRRARAPVGEIGKADEGPRAHSKQFVEHPVGPRGGLQRLAEDGIIEALVGIIAEVAVRIALHHRKALRYAALDTGAIDFDPAHVAALVAQGHHQHAVPATDIQHPAVGGDPTGNRCQIGTLIDCRHAHPRNPPITRSSAGTSSRKLSCPCGADSSTKLTAAPAALSACTTWRLSLVG